MRHSIRWTAQKIQKRLEEIAPLNYRQSNLIPPFQFCELSDPMEFSSRIAEVDDSAWIEIPYHSHWGVARTNFVLRSSFRVTESWIGNGPIALYLPIGNAGDFSHPEAMVYLDGQPYAACDRHHQEIILPEVWCDGKYHPLLLHGWTGIGGSTIGNPDKKLQMEPCKVVLIDQPTCDFIALARVALGIADHLDQNQPEHHHLLTALDEAFKLLDIRQPIGDAFYESVPTAYQLLQEGVGKSGSPLEVDITAVGHAHIDVAWLWTLDQTSQKVRRTFHNVLRLMEQFPEFHFTQSQPQLYEFVRQDFPALYSQIKERVAEKRWEPIGGMWVEADCNLSGPESLVRQFLLGRNFYRQQFGESAETPVLWLPDVFGYAWNLPQLIKEAGLDYFFTIKIGWSQYNRFPYDSFWWQGLDGTRVLTHFSTTKNPESVHASTYNSDASPGQILGSWFNFQQKDYGTPGQIPPLLMSFGWGDGGGGPTREMLENIRVMENFPATPKTHTGTVNQFFRKLEKESGKYLPTWNGELYLEYHRGTYTTQARVKRANRKSEFLLHDAEFVAVCAVLLDPGYSYPFSNFTEAWKLICLNQFHDIIPGSSIGPVYEEALLQYKEVRNLGETEKNLALNSISNCFDGDFLLINPTSFARDEVVLFPVSVDDPKSQGCQPTESGVLIRVGELPPYSISPVEFNSLVSEKNEVGFPPIKASTEHLENAFLKIKFNKKGDIIRIFDKIAERDVIPKEAVANQFQAFEDIPLSWDAWDIEIYYDDKQWLADPATLIRVIEAGPLRGRLEIRRKILNSNFSQIVTLHNNSPRIDFETKIDWQERKILLKTAFPVDVLSPKASYEIQWGNVERPTHRNTSWDWARFETAAQKWVDLSEGGYGVSLLNDCKYGHDIYENVIRLTLLRGTTAPDPYADLGEHEFSYSLFPHLGKWDEHTIAQAYALNDPIIVVPLEEKKSKSTQLPLKNFSLVAADQPNIVIETVKQAEDGNGIIVRLYESQRKRGRINLKTAFKIDSAWETNLLEENRDEIKIREEKRIELMIDPYQILTLRLIAGGEI